MENFQIGDRVKLKFQPFYVMFIDGFCDKPYPVIDHNTNVSFTISDKFSYVYCRFLASDEITLKTEIFHANNLTLLPLNL